MRIIFLVMNFEILTLYTQLFLLPSRSQDLKEYGSCTFLTKDLFWTLHAQQNLFCSDAWIWESEKQGNESGFPDLHFFNLIFAFLVAILTNDNTESAHSLEMCISILTIVKSTAQKRHIIKSNVSGETISYNTFNQNLGKQELQKHFSVYSWLPLLIKYSILLIEESFAMFLI